MERRALDQAVPAPVLAEGTGQIRAIPGAFDPEIDDERPSDDFARDFDEVTVVDAAPALPELVQELVTPLTVILAVQARILSATGRAAPELLDELVRDTERGREAMDTIHRVLAALRAQPR